MGNSLDMVPIRLRLLSQTALLIPDIMEKRVWMLEVVPLELSRRNAWKG